MNIGQNDFMAESHRREVIEQIEGIRLERSALRSRVYRPRLYERTMFKFANWMISTGKQLRQRYEIPAVQCNKMATRSFAE